MIPDFAGSRNGQDAAPFFPDAMDFVQNTRNLQFAASGLRFAGTYFIIIL
jgi:hypothetical protein